MVASLVDEDVIFSPLKAVCPVHGDIGRAYTNFTWTSVDEDQRLDTEPVCFRCLQDHIKQMFPRLKFPNDGGINFATDTG